MTGAGRTHKSVEARPERDSDPNRQLRVSPRYRLHKRRRVSSGVIFVSAWVRSERDDYTPAIKE